MRPNPPHDPTIEPVEEPSDVGFLIVLAPSPKQGIQFLNQLLGPQRHFPLRPLPHLIHETTDRLYARVRIQRTRPYSATNLALGKIKLALPALNFVAEKLEPVLDVDD